MGMAKMIEPPHEVRDHAKLDELVSSMRRDGWIGRPLLAIEIADYLQALTGSHRLAASKLAKVEPEIFEIEDVVLTAEQVDVIEIAAPSLTWENYWSNNHYLSEALMSAHDDEDRLVILRAVCGDDAEATQLMLAETESNRGWRRS